jgi:hypothetical protein
MFLVGAIGFELWGARIAQHIASAPIADLTREQWVQIKRSWPYVVEVTAEESFEMCGLILYIVGALGYLSRRGVEFKVSFGRAPAHL